MEKELRFRETIEDFLKFKNEKIKLLASVAWHRGYTVSEMLNELDMNDITGEDQYLILRAFSDMCKEKEVI